MLFKTGSVLVSREDYPALNEFNWTIHRSRNSRYAMTRILRGERYERISMHRLKPGPSRDFVTPRTPGDGERAPSKIRGIATIRRDGKTINLGTYPTIEAAGLSYNKAAKELHGERAILNMIDEMPK